MLSMLSILGMAALSTLMALSRADASARVWPPERWLAVRRIRARDRDRDRVRVRARARVRATPKP